MPKALCWTGMVIAILVLALFLFDLVVPSTMAPFKKSSIVLDVLFVLCAGALAYLSWATLREQDKR
jgi:threonine/homoserine/homoserine lactone efflux protein